MSDASRINIFASDLLGTNERAALRVKCASLARSTRLSMQNQAESMGLQIDWMRDTRYHAGVLYWKHIQVGLLFERATQETADDLYTAGTGAHVSAAAAWVVVDLLRSADSEQDTLALLTERLQKLEMELDSARALLKYQD